MKPITFTGANAVLTGPDGVSKLPIRREIASGGVIQMSVWKPTEDDLVALLSGTAGVQLSIHSEQHPVVSLHIVPIEAPEEGEGYAH